MAEITKNDIETVLTSLVSRSNDELYNTPEDELIKYFYFKFDDTKSHEWNLYKFADSLDMYRERCRRWEEHHNGYSCVVERVRDKYLMPQIKNFLAEIKK